MVNSLRRTLRRLYKTWDVRQHRLYYPLQPDRLLRNTLPKAKKHRHHPG